MITKTQFMERYKAACDLKQPVDRGQIVEAFNRYTMALSGVTLKMEFLSDAEGVARGARDAWVARDAWDAWDAWVAWVARDAWDAWVARDARDARDARVAWDARDARDARVAWDCSWVASAIASAIAAKNEDLYVKFLPILEAFEAGAWLYFIGKETIYVCELPKVHTDAARRLHREDGPAFAWQDVQDYYWHGVLVNKAVVMAPEAITVKAIMDQDNAEVRRVMMERYGHDRFILDSGSKLLHQDDYGKLWRKDIPGDVPLVMVEMVNSTPEPDGTFKDYFERVDPECRPILSQEGEPMRLGEPQELTARNAIASTFGLRGEAYELEMES